MFLYVVEGFQRLQYGDAQKDLWEEESRVRFEFWKQKGLGYWIHSALLALGGPAGVQFEPAVS